MSRKDGKYIAIKFTQPLVNDVSEKFPRKAYKYYRWDFYGSYASNNVLYLHEVELYFNEAKINNNTISNISGSSQSSATYAATRAFDDNTSNHWRTSTSFTLPHHLTIGFTNPTQVDFFKWYVTGSYNPESFILYGSNDEINWEKLLKTGSPNSNGWHEFSIPKKGNETAFIVSGKELLFPDVPSGPKLDKTYEVELVELYPETTDTILLTMAMWDNFNNAYGNLSIDYDGSKGNLAGSGGMVESFSMAFTPTGLSPLPRHDNVTVAPTHLDIELNEVVYSERGVEESIVGPYPVYLELTLTQVEDENP